MAPLQQHNHVHVRAYGKAGEVLHSEVLMTTPFFVLTKIQEKNFYCYTY